MHYKNSIITALAFIFVQLSASDIPTGAEAAYSYDPNEMPANTCSVCDSYCVYWPSEAISIEKAEEKEPVDFSRYQFEAEVFAMCTKAVAQGYVSEDQRHTCGELADTIRLMERLGQERQAEAKRLINKTYDANVHYALLEFLYEANKKALAINKSNRIFTFQEKQVAGLPTTRDSVKDVKLAYLNIFIKNMAGNDPQTYFKLQTVLWDLLQRKFS